MTDEDAMRRHCALSKGWPPAISSRREIDRREHLVDDAIEDVVFVLDVVVERHGLDAEGVAESPHGQCGQPTCVG
jgi:hypothetical protein